jgi:hypothetical protein
MDVRHSMVRRLFVPHLSVLSHPKIRKALTFARAIPKVVAQKRRMGTCRLVRLHKLCPTPTLVPGFGLDPAIHLDFIPLCYMH